MITKQNTGTRENSKKAFSQRHTRRVVVVAAAGVVVVVVAAAAVVVQRGCHDTFRTYDYRLSCF